MEGHAWISVEVIIYGFYIAGNTISDTGLSKILTPKSLQRFVS